MFDAFFQLLTQVDEWFWGYAAFALILVLGFYMTFRAGFFQVRRLPQIFKTFFQCLGKEKSERGVHPLKAFFASTGGMIGIGNVAGVVTAVQFGGPGALFWVWIAGTIGAIVKYSEIFLGLKFRVENNRGGYDGGPMYFLRRAFKSRFLPLAIAGLLCVYGVEIYQFSVITDSISTNWHLPRVAVMLVLLGAVLYASIGGVKRIGRICTWVMPFFLTLYVAMGLWVLTVHAPQLPAMLLTVIKSAFTGHAAVGGFAGASIILAIQHGVARAAYSADIGIGYDSIIQSESSSVEPAKQARLAILGVFIDNVICTLSILIVLLSGAWTSSVEGSQLVQVALSQYFPLMQFFVPFFFIVTGYTTLIAYFCVGLKCARYLAPRWGTKVYLLYAIAAFVLFSFVPQGHALLVMSVSGAMLLMVNMLGMFKLRHEISFEVESTPAKDFVY